VGKKKKKKRFEDLQPLWKLLGAEEQAIITLSAVWLRQLRVRRKKERV
jgi:hypothetical protein